MPKVSYRIFKKVKEGKNLYLLNLVHLNEKDEIINVGKNIITLIAMDDVAAKKDFEWNLYAMKWATYEAMEDYNKYKFNEDKEEAVVWGSELDPFDNNKDKILDGI